jgi:hypothetical protein
MTGIVCVFSGAVMTLVGYHKAEEHWFYPPSTRQAQWKNLFRTIMWGGIFTLLYGAHALLT